MGADFIFSDLRIETVEVFEQQAGNSFSHNVVHSLFSEIT